MDYETAYYCVIFPMGGAPPTLDGMSVADHPLSTGLLHTKAETLVDHQQTPYASALGALAAIPWDRLDVPAHQGHSDPLEDLVGAGALARDLPMSVVAIDQATWRPATSGSRTPLDEAQALAADLWGASRTWFLTNGASGGNHVATTVARALGPVSVVQRSVHGSVIDGSLHVGLEPHFVAGTVDAELGTVHVVTAEAVERALTERPDAASVYLVSPSYFGAVADVGAIAAVAHSHDVPLIVDEAWGSHLGLHPWLPRNAVQSGADLVISSTHKGAGSLTQSAMLHLGHGPWAERIESLTERVVRSYQSTSSSALLLASLDLARHHLATRGGESVGAAIESAQAIRAGLASAGRFREAGGRTASMPGTFAVDPLKLAVDVRGVGLTGTQAMHLLIKEHRVYPEMATPAAVLVMVGATSPADPARVLAALHALPDGPGSVAPVPLPTPGARAMSLREAFLAETEIVPAADAVGRVSADSLAAYPPGTPNALPGETLTAEVIDYLQLIAASPAGFVRGAVDPDLDRLRVVAVSGR